MGTTGPRQQARNPSPRWTSTATSRSQRAAPTGAPNPSGHSRTATASSSSQWALPDHNSKLHAVGTPGPQQQWAPSDLNSMLTIAVGTPRPPQQAPDRKLQIAVCTPGPQRQARDRSGVGTHNGSDSFRQIPESVKKTTRYHRCCLVWA